MLLALTALLMSLGSRFAAQAEPSCTRSIDCEQLALDAARREDFETFHSLAWRAVQTGPPNDTDLMFMLARAQALSGRPDDALVMLGRLADRGIAHAEVETLDDFRRVRNMVGWPSLFDRMRGIAASTARPVAAISAAAPTARPAPATLRAAPSHLSAPPSAPPVDKPSAPTASSLASKPDGAALMAEPIAGSIPVPPTVAAPVAIAYDKVSGRVIIADDSSGTLKVVSEVSGNPVDLVSSGWGGGYRTNALVIDSKRGDLWVVGARTGAEGPESIIHRLQLVSGRLLYSVPRPEDSGATRFAAVALSAAGVFVLDAEGSRIFELGNGGKTLSLRMVVRERDLTGLTLASNTVAYVAHAGGILRIDLATKRSEAVTVAHGVGLEGIEWIGYFENSLLALQLRPDGSRAAVRFQLDRGGRIATAVDVFGTAAGRGAAVLGDAFFYIASLSEGGTSVARVNLRRPRRQAPPEKK